MKARSFLFVNLGILFLTGCTDINNPYPYGGGGYNYPSSYPSGGYYGGGYDDRRDRWEDRRLDDERRRLEDERRRLEDQRRNQQYPPRWQPPANPYPYPPAGQPRPQPPRQNDRCPPGFSPSEQKCSPQERARGCRDIRTPSGLGCVSR